MKKVMALRLLWGTLFFSLISASPVLSMMSQNIPPVKLQDKKEPTAHEILLRYVAVMRDLKKRVLEKEDEELDRKWDKYFEGKSLDDLRGDLEKTVTGKVLVNLSLKQLSMRTLEDTLVSHLEELESMISRNANYLPIDGTKMGEPGFSEILKKRKKEVERLQSIDVNNLNKIIKKMIENEIKYKDEYYVFYTSVKGTVRLLFDVMSEFSSYFSIDSFYDKLKLRDSDKNMQKYFNSMDEYIKEFLKNGDDHSDFARQTLISTRLSIVSSPGDAGESTLFYFLTNNNQIDPSTTVLKSLLSKFLRGKNIDDRVTQYLKLSEKIGRYQNSSIIQIFIKKNEATNLAYPCRMFGIPAYPSPDNTGRSLISDFILYFLNEPSSKLDSDNDPFYSLQARVLMNMEKFLDPNIVKIKIFDAKNIYKTAGQDIEPKNDTSGLKPLSKLVQEDVVYYLEHASKEEREQNKLESLKDIMKAGEEIERLSPPTESSKKYEDPEFQGLGRVVPNAWKPQTGDEQKLWDEMQQEVFNVTKEEIEGLEPGKKVKFDDLLNHFKKFGIYITRGNKKLNDGEIVQVLGLMLKNNHMDDLVELYIELKKVSELENIVMPGDLVLLNIDKTILNSALLNLGPKLSHLVKNWRMSNPASQGEKKIQVVLLLERSSEFENKVREQFNQLGFPNDVDIVFAPNSSKDNASTKGIALLHHLTQLSQMPKRIIMVDPHIENLKDVQHKLKINKTYNNIPLLLFKMQGDDLEERLQLMRELEKPPLELIHILENITWVEDKKIGGKWIEAPFTARDVVERVKGSTIIYKIEFLKTNEGFQLISEIINQLNEHIIPKDADFSLYDRKNPESGINKLLIASYASGLKAISDSKR